MSEWFEEDEGGSLAGMIPIRNELIAGDRRPLYLGWLLAVQLMYGGYDEDEEDEEVGEGITEPPVPPGLGSLSGPQQALADYLNIDPDLIAAAAERSGKAREDDPAAHKEHAAWVKGLPTADKDAMLLRVLRGEAAGVGMEMQRRFRDERPSKMEKPRAEPLRTVAELRERAGQMEAERQERERQKKQRDREAAERRQAEAREEKLRSLAGREESLWREADHLVGTKQPRNYDEAVAMLLDLRELASRAGASAAFGARLQEIRKKHAAKYSFIERLDKKGLS